MADTSSLNMGLLHFVGIGGIGMSGIAEVLHNLGYAIQGTDITDNANIQRLRTLGIPIIIGHAAENLGKATVVVVSTAIQEDNPEIFVARERLIPVLQRAEMLAELIRLNKYSIAIAGTHGKTTTTSMVAMLLDIAGFDPTVINGGIINAYGTNAKLGKGDWIVVEADESDGTFTKLPTTIAIVTNIDSEHLGFWGSFNRIEEAFHKFAQSIPVSGLAVLCLDHKRVQSLIPKISERRIITYGLSPQADVRAFNIRLSTNGTVFDVLLVDRKEDSYRVLQDINLPMHGIHNVQNSLAAVAVAIQLGITDTMVMHAFRNFSGVKRRFTCAGVVNGITIIDDYGHHPVEISAVLKAARDICEGRIIVVVQPHRYSRLRDLFESFCTCFNDADVVIVADIYSAGESPLNGIHRDALIVALRARGHHHVIALPDDLIPEYILARLIYPLAEPGDYIICVGAGNITQWANALPTILARMYSEE